MSSSVLIPSSWASRAVRIDHSAPLDATQGTALSTGFLNQSETSRANIGESNLDFELIMPLLGKTQEVILYQVCSTCSVVCSVTSHTHMRL